MKKHDEARSLAKLLRYSKQNSPLNADEQFTESSDPQSEI